MSYDMNITEPPDPRIARTEWKLRILERIAQRGAEIIDATADQACADAKTSPESPKGRDPAGAYAQASRAVRMTLVLDARFADYLAALRAGDPDAEFCPRRARPNPRRAAPFEEDTSEEDLSAVDPREIIRGNVLEIINPDSYDEDGREWIYEELDERLYESERYNEFLDLPMEDLVELICKDLGVKPDWERWDGYEWPPWRTDKTRTKPASCPPVARQGDDVLRTLSVPAGPAPNIPDDPYPDSG
jgi:hypothetical protein